MLSCLVPRVSCEAPVNPFLCASFDTHVDRCRCPPSFSRHIPWLQSADQSRKQGADKEAIAQPSRFGRKLQRLQAVSRAGHKSLKTAILLFVHLMPPAPGGGKERGTNMDGKGSLVAANVQARLPLEPLPPHPLDACVLRYVVANLARHVAGGRARLGGVFMAIEFGENGPSAGKAALLLLSDSAGGWARDSPGPSEQSAQPSADRESNGLQSPRRLCRPTWKGMRAHGTLCNSGSWQELAEGERTQHARC